MDENTFRDTYSNLSPIKQRVLRSVHNGQGNLEISKSLNISHDQTRHYISQLYSDFFDDRQPNRRFKLINICEQYRHIIYGTTPLSSPTSHPVIRWELPSIQNFLGRTDELDRIREYVLNQECRLLSIIGMSGIGKSVLVSQAIRGIENQFDYIIGLNVQRYIQLSNLLNEWLNLLNISDNRTNLENPTVQINLLIEWLQTHHSLLVLDNIESIMSEGRVGEYNENYGDYESLISCLSDSMLRSCLIIISREKPSHINYNENGREICYLPLSGLNISDCEQLFIHPSSSIPLNSEYIWEQLAKYSGRDPQILRILLSYIQDLSNEDILHFCEKRLTFSYLDKVRQIINEQLNRLSNLEKEIVYWLSINCETVTRRELEQNIVTWEAQQHLDDSINSLRFRLFIEDTPNGYTLQPVIMHYATKHFIDDLINQIQINRLDLFDNYSFGQATKPDYIRDTQIKFFINPIVEQLRDQIGEGNINSHLRDILRNPTDQSLPEPSLKRKGYAAANLLSLLRHLRTQLDDKYNFSSLTLRESDLRNCPLQNVNFSDSYFENCLFSSPLGGVLWVVFSYDGNLLAAGDVNGTVHIWTVDQYLRNPTLVPKCRFTGYNGWIWTIRFSPDNKYLAIAGDRHDIHIWNLETKQRVGSLQGHTDSIRSLSFNYNGFLASASDDKTIKIWNLSDLEHLDDLEQRECVRTLEEHEARVRSVSFNPANPNLLATASDDGTVKIWNLDDENSTRTFPVHQGDIRTVCFSPCGELVASAGNDRALRLWNLTTSTSECRSLEGHTDWVRSVDFNHDGTQLLSASEDQTVKLWDTQSGRCIETFYGHNSWVQSVRFSPNGPNGSKFASGSADRTVKLWDVNQGCLTTIQGYTNCLFTIAFNPTNASILASGYEDSNIRLWDVTTGRCIGILQGHHDWVRSVTFSSDGKLIASSSGDRTVRIWRRNNSTLSYHSDRPFKDHTSWIRQVRFTPDDRFLASCSDDQTIKIWGVNSGKLVKTLTEHQGWVRAIAFSADGQLLASAGGDRTVKLWSTEDIYNTRNTHSIQTLEGHSDWVWSVAFNPKDSQMLASAGGDGTVRIWSRNSDNQWGISQVLRRHSKSVRAVVFSPDGETLASGSVDRTLLLWNTQTWKKIDDLGKQTDWIRSLAFSSQGHLASASQDGTIQIWGDLQRRNPTTIQLPKLYKGMDVRGATGLSEAQKQDLRALGAIVNE